MNGNAPDLRQDKEAVVKRRPIAELLKGKGVETIASLKARKSCLLSRLDPTEERLRGLVEPRQHILQNVRVNRRVLWECRPYLLQLGFLLEP
jgi:hypothetical protein